MLTSVNKKTPRPKLNKPSKKTSILPYALFDPPQNVGNLTHSNMIHLYTYIYNIVPLKTTTWMAWVMILQKNLRNKKNPDPRYQFPKPRVMIPCREESEATAGGFHRCPFGLVVVVPQHWNGCNLIRKHTPKHTSKK